MNEWYATFKLPTDFVYTAKMMYGILDMIKNDFFAKGSHIVCVHSGGLQGNLSLRKGILTYN
jgi:1-aminocyclopropane-1-carboxylate deaminase/D-cysteine desulfhydrase-like pyridoxal-dependent ACC family enzyme